MGPMMQFSRTELNFLCNVLGELSREKTVSIKTEEIKKVNVAIVQLRTYERMMVRAGYWG